MRKRAYCPEVPGCLENRSLLSGVAGLSAHPIVLTRRQFNQVPERIQTAFHLFRQGNGISHLHDDILSAVAIIPFGRVDGLGASINGILGRMQHDMRRSPRRRQHGPQRLDRRSPCGCAGPGAGRRYRRAVIAAE